jgi:putative ABC transport system permease protein
MRPKARALRGFLSNLRFIYEARFGARAALVQEGFAVLGIAVGVALLFASQVASTSLTHAVARLNSQLVGNAQLQLRARSYEGVSDQLLTAVRAAPGVRSAVPLIERQTDLQGPHGDRSVELIGVEPSTLKVTGPLLRRFSARQLVATKAVALPVPIAREIGVRSLEPVKLLVGAAYVETLIGATLTEEDIGGLENSPLAITSLRYAQQLTEAPHRLTRVFIHYDPSQRREAIPALEKLARGWNVNLESSTAESQIFAVAVSAENKSELLFSVIAALVGFMFALDAMLITVPSRRRLIADLRPHGMAPTMAVLLIDATVIGIVACALGLVLGDLLSIAVFNPTPGFLKFAFPIGNSRIVTWPSVAWAVGAGMIAALLGVLWPMRTAIDGGSRRATRLFERRPFRAGLALGGLLCLGVTTFTLVADPHAAMIGNIALVFALLLVLPLFFDAAVWSFERIERLLNDFGSRIAVEELRNPRTYVRYLAIAGTAGLAVFGTVEFGGTQANLTRGLHASIQSMDSSANLWVVPSGSDSLQTTVPFRPIDVRRLAALPGVRRVDIYRGSFLDWQQRRLWVIAPAPSVEHAIPAPELLEGSLPDATSRLRSGGWALLSQGVAEEYHLHIGEPFVLPSPRPMTLRLAGVTTNLGWPPGAMIVNSTDYAQAWGTSAASAYLIQTTAQTPPGTAKRLVARSLAGSGLAVQTSEEREQRHYAAVSQGLSRLTQIRILILTAAILAIVGALGAMLWSRKEHIASLKCHGVEEGKLWWSLLAGNGVTLAAGCSAGALFGLYAQLLGSHFLSTVTGFPIVFNIEGTAAVVSFALVTVTTVAVLAVPGYLVVRVRPSTAQPAL